MTIKYIDYQGNPISFHDGTALFISDDKGYQFFGLDGKGFLHDGAVIELPDGRKQFFLEDGAAIIHDGSPIELADGKMQYFDQDGIAMWPVDEKRLIPLANKQREVFFKEMIKGICKNTPLTKSEIEDLRLAFIAADHPDSEEEQFLAWSKEENQTGLKPICDEMVGALLHFEILWPRVWKKYQLRHKELLSARHILYQIKLQEKCPLASLRTSESMLVNELILEFKKVEKIFQPFFNSNTILKDLKITSKGVFELDDVLLKYVKKMRKGEGTEVFIDNFKDVYKSQTVKIQPQINKWKNPLFVYQCIAHIIWLNSVKERAEGAYRKPPALPLIVSDTLNELMKRGTTFDDTSGKITDKRGNELALIDKNNLDHIPSIKMATLQKILSPQNAKILSSLNFHRLYRWEIETATRQIIENISDARMIHIPGGYPELAHRIGAGRGGKARDQVRDILAWQAAPKSFILYDKHGNEKIVAEGNMLTFERIHGGSKSSWLNIVMGTMLLPHSVFKTIKSSSKKLSSEAVMMIPIPEYPNLIGKTNTHASQMIFQMEFLALMRKKIKELMKNNCIFIPPDKMETLAQKATLSTPFHLRVIDSWMNDGDAPAFLKLVEKDHYALGTHFKQDQDFIIEGGKRELALSRAGKNSAKKRSRGIFQKNSKKTTN